MLKNYFKNFKSKIVAILNERNSYLVVDLGSSNTLIYVKNKGIVVNEPTIISINRKVNKVVAIGKSAQRMKGKTPENINVIQPVEHGTIYDFEATKRYLNLLVQDFFDTRLSIFSRVTVLTSCPPLTDDIQLKALQDVFYELEFNKVLVIKETILAAIGMGLKIMSAKPNFIIDIGGGTTNIAVISLNETIIEKSLKVAGRRFDQDIKEYIEDKFDLIIGDETAQKIKILIGSAVELDKKLEMQISGKVKDTLMPGEIVIHDAHIRSALNDSIEYIIEDIKDTLKKVPPEFTKDLLKNGVYLTGGSSMLRGLRQLFEQHLAIKVHTPQDPFISIIKGGIEVFRDLDKWESVFLK